MKVAILVFALLALFALTAVAQEEQYQPEVEFRDLFNSPIRPPSNYPPRYPRGVREPPRRFRPGKMFLPSQREVQEEFEFVDEPQDYDVVYYYYNIDEVQDFNLPNRQQVANGFHKAGNVAGTVSNVAGKVSNIAGKASSGLHWVGNKIGGKELEEVVIEDYLY
mgnify:CR=1 FL=1